MALADEAETIQVFQTPSLTPRFALAGHLDTINALCYSDDGARLASGGKNDGATRLLWDVADGRPQAALAGLQDQDTAVFTPDGYCRASRLVSSSVAFRLGERAYPFEQFDLRLNRPDLVLTALGCL